MSKPKPDAPDPVRAAFELLVTQWTGRDMEYHNRCGTTGLDFAWFCYAEATEAADSRRLRDVAAQEVPNAGVKAPLRREPVAVTWIQDGKRHFREWDPKGFLLQSLMEDGIGWRILLEEG